MSESDDHSRAVEAEDASHPEREHTDESLRAEREKVDDAIGEKLTAIDQMADAVIRRARARADQLIAAARAKTDRQSTEAVPSVRLERERHREDVAVRSERDHADETVRVERAAHVALLSSEREETDKDLFTERARSDAAVATRDEFLGIVGHELLNMLNSIVGYASLIERAESSVNHRQPAVEYTQRIQRSAARMERLIGDLIDVASIEAGQLAVSRELGDPAAVVMEAVESFGAQAAARRVELVAEIVPPSPAVAFDPARILQVLVNLLSNAIKFTPKNGRVAVRVERIGDEVRFSVRDTGVGVPKDKLEVVFDRFLQLDENDRRGVGLGLYISKCIVEGHGGRIWATSTIGEGSTFWFNLPMK